MEGFIVLHRKFLEWEWFDMPEMVKLFVYLLLKANHKEKEWRGAKIKRGQLVTGRKQMSRDLNISEQSVRTCINRLKSTNEITIKSTSKFSIITICKYDTYQNKKNTNNQQNNQQIPNEQPTTNQQLTTTNNDNNETNKQIKKRKKNASISPKNLEIITTLKKWCSDKSYFAEKYLKKSDDVFDKLIRIDNYTPKQISQAIHNAKNDDFWTQQLISPNKLRKKNSDDVSYIDVFLNLKTEKKEQKQTSSISVKTILENQNKPIK